MSPFPGEKRDGVRAEEKVQEGEEGRGDGALETAVRLVGHAMLSCLLVDITLIPLMSIIKCII